jgi:hypothetical protein
MVCRKETVTSAGFFALSLNADGNQSCTEIRCELTKLKQPRLPTELDESPLYPPPRLPVGRNA